MSTETAAPRLQPHFTPELGRRIDTLTCEVEKLGYQIESRRDAQGRDCGFEIRGISEELRRVGFAQAMTVERMLQNQQAQRNLHGKALTLDEEGIVSGRQTIELLHLAASQSTRIVFSGNTKQIQSVEACDALRISEKESELKSISLEQVQRQANGDYREAIQELRRDPHAGFEKLDSIGAIGEVDWIERAEAIAKGFAGSDYW